METREHRERGRETGRMEMKGWEKEKVTPSRRETESTHQIKEQALLPSCSRAVPHIFYLASADTK